jgi:AcrR family transcriptional regulator
MDRFERRKQRSKEDILRAAEELFSRFGVDRVSVNDIAEQAGVSQATVYNNFGTKEELVSDYRKTMANRIADRFRDILVWKKSFIEKFQGFLQSWIDFTDKYRLETAGRESPDDPAHRKSPSLFAQEIEKALLEFIEDGKKQGQIDPKLSNEAVTAYMQFFQEGLSAHPEIQNKLSRNPRLKQDLLSLFMYGINGKCALPTNYR